jgi:hypothetical protein
MAPRVRAVRDLEEYRAPGGPIGHHVGGVTAEADSGRLCEILARVRMHPV